MASYAIEEAVINYATILIMYEREKEALAYLRKAASIVKQLDIHLAYAKVILMAISLEIGQGIGGDEIEESLKHAAEVFG